MSPDQPKPTEHGPKFTLLVIGRLHGLTWRRLVTVVGQVGGKLTAKPTPRVDLVALAHASAHTVLSQGPSPAVPAAITSPVKVVSELTLKRMLGLAPASPKEDRTLNQGDLTRGSKLSAEVLECLGVFDVLEPVEGTYAYADLLVAREVKRLLDRGYGLDVIVTAALALGRSHRSLCEGRLIEAPWGEVMQETFAGLARLDGQLLFPLGHAATNSDELFERAEIAETSGHLTVAERLYRTAMAVDRTDAASAYNLGNVLDAQGRRREAVRSYYEALQRDPGFAEAWFNLGVIDEDESRTAEAISHYRAALSAQPNFSDALFNLALILTDHESYIEAAPLWERFIALSPQGADTTCARRYAALCRLAQTRLQGQPRRTATKKATGQRIAARQALLW